MINVLKYILSIRIPLCYAVGLTFWFQVQLNDDGIQGVVTNSAKCSGGKHIGLWQCLGGKQTQPITRKHIETEIDGPSGHHPAQGRGLERSQQSTERRRAGVVRKKQGGWPPSSMCGILYCLKATGKMLNGLKMSWRGSVSVGFGVGITWSGFLEKLIWAPVSGSQRGWARGMWRKVKGCSVVQVRCGGGLD